MGNNYFPHLKREVKQNLPKIGKLKIDTFIIPQGLLIHKKTRVQKSHASVPLTSKNTKIDKVGYIHT